MTDHPRLTLDLVRATMDEIVKEHPEKTVDGGGCRYAAREYEGPSCVVGAMLFQLGWTYEELKALDNADATEYGGTTISELIYADYVETDPNVLGYLQNMQTVQDGYKPWLEAYRYAEDNL
jgi:hypothetical protein